MNQEEAQNKIDILKIIDKKIEQVRTRSLDLSFNEILDMYHENEFEISPDYQRLFRWSIEKESQFIESLILEMPIPPIYVIEKEESVYELIDGLQRISTYLHFRGELAHSENVNEEKKNQLKLDGCDIVTELNGLTYDDLPKTLQIRLKRAFVRVEIIRKDSDPRLRYYMFKRLNTGGELLSEQEVRNCTVRLLDDTLNEFIIELSTNNDFKTTMENLTPAKLEKKEDQEYVLKYFAYKIDSGSYKKDIAPFLTTFMEKVADDDDENHIELDYAREKVEFEKTFKILNNALGNRAFDKKGKNGNYIMGVTSTHYDAFTLGIQNYLDKIDPENTELMEKIGGILDGIKSNDKFKESTTGGGKNTKAHLQKRISVVNEEIGGFLNGYTKDTIDN